MSQIENCDCFVCFSLLHSEYHIVWAWLKLKIEESTFAKSSGGSSDKFSGSAGTKFSSRSHDIVYLIGSNHWNEDSLNWCLSENTASLWQVKNCNLSRIVQTKFFSNNSSLLFHTEYAPSTWNTKFFAHHVYSRVDLFSCVCWSWLFLPDESHSGSSTVSSILSVFDRKFRISLKPLSLWSPKKAAINTAILMGRIFKTWCEFIK